MNDRVLVYKSVPPYTPGQYLPRVVIDDAETRYVFPLRTYVDRIASRQTADGATEYLLHVTVTDQCR